jgi:hypothetical protein
MGDYAYTAAKIRPGDGAIVRKAKCAGAIDLGMTVKKQLDGTIVKSNNDVGYGVLVATEGKASASVSGEECVVVILGPVEGYSGLNPGMIGFLSATAGKIATTGTKGMGYNSSPTCFIVMPALTTAASS